MAGTSYADANGTQCALNDNVKLVGTVSALNQSDTRYNTVTVLLTHPVDNTVVSVIVPALALVHGS
jgi:hypothetical protein